MKLKTKNLHILIIIFGIIINSISIFHSNLWFDEAYSVGLASKSFSDIWKIGGHDVHPVLYYWILHIIYLITNSIGLSHQSIIISYRIFSGIIMAILGILGYTHIRKDFGEKVGMMFSFFSYFLPAVSIFTSEIRMYSLSAVLITILAIYAYRLFHKDQDTVKNWIIFGITSLACIYVHYYALIAAGITNLILLWNLIKQKRKSSIITILTFGFIQLIAYIPWIIYFVKQLKHVAKGFWVGFTFPNSLIEILSANYIGELKIIVFLVSILIYTYLGFKAYKSIKNKEQWNPGMMSILLYIGVISAVLIVTVFLRTPILYYRYLFVITGFYIFAISFFLAKENKKIIIYSICAVTLVLSISNNYNQIKEVYDKSNSQPIAYLKENIQQDDVIVCYENNYRESASIFLTFLDNKQFYYNPLDWGVKEAYEAFGNQLQVCTNTEFLNECNNRIWILDKEDFEFYNLLFNNSNFKFISNKIIATKYENYSYNLVLVERVN